MYILYAVSQETVRIVFGIFCIVLCDAVYNKVTQLQL